MSPNKVRPPIERMLARVVQVGECWLYTGARTPGGYGQLISGGHAGPRVYAHRVAFEHFVGPIPPGYEIDHLCRSPACVRPEHLEAVTPGENRARVTRARTHCPQGHPYSDENVYWHSGWRYCRACRTIRAREYKARKRQEARA